MSWILFMMDILPDLWVAAAAPSSPRSFCTKSENTTLNIKHSEVNSTWMQCQAAQYYLKALVTLIQIIIIQDMIKDARRMSLLHLCFCISESLKNLLLCLSASVDQIQVRTSAGKIQEWLGVDVNF
jgi:hypothetical protein